MIYTPAEYAKKFPIKGKVMSAMTVKRRCEKNMLPSNHHARKLSGGWIIEVSDELADPIKEEKPKLKPMNKTHYNW